MRYRKDSAIARLKPDRRIEIVGEKVKLREKRIADARNDYVWQTDRELAKLDAAPLLSVSFPVYLLQYTEGLLELGPGRYPLAVTTLEDKHIGNCTCYDINDSRGEAQVGIMIGDRDYWDKGYGTDALTALVNHIFLKTKLKRTYLKTLDWNLRAQKCFDKCGFSACGRLKSNGNNFVVMELTHPQWEKRRESQKG